MNKFNLLLFLVIAAFSSTAQQTAFQQQVCPRKTTVELNTITDSAKQTTCIFLMDADSIRALVFNNKMEVMQSFSVLRRQDENPLGGCINNGIVYYFFRNEKADALHTWLFNYNTGEVTQKFQLQDMLKEKEIAHISSGNHFLFCTLNKKTKDFAVYDFTSDTASNIMRYKSETIWEDFTKSYGLGRDIDMKAVASEGDCSVDIAACLNKMYVTGDTLYVISNKQKGTSNVYTFNLAAKTVSLRKIIHDDVQNKSVQPDFVNNSFRWQNKLYYVWATTENIGVQIISFFSGNVLQKFGASKKTDIEFKNTPVIQEGGGTVYFKQTRELDATSKLLRKMTRGNAVIFASPADSNRIAITIGSYMELASPGGGMWMPGGGLPGVPAMTYIPTGGFSRNGAVKSARFKMLVNEANEHVEGEMPLSVNEKIEAYTMEQKITTDRENLFKNNGIYYYVYYNRKEGRMTILKW